MKVRLSLFAVFEISWQNVCEVQVSQAMIMKFRFLRQLFVFFLHNPFFWKLALRHALDNSEMASTPLSCIPFETYHHHFQLLRIIITRSRKTASEMHVTPWICHRQVATFESLCMKFISFWGICDLDKMFVLLVSCGEILSLFKSCWKEQGLGDWGEECTDQNFSGFCCNSLFPAQLF